MISSLKLCTKVKRQNYYYCLILLLLFGLLLSVFQDSEVANYDRWDLSNSLLDQDSKVYIERKNILQNECFHFRERNRSHDWYNSGVLSHILVDNRNSLLYCYVPKVACTNWKRVFMILSGSTNITEPLLIQSQQAHNRSNHISLNQYSRHQIFTILKNYKKFLFVRHPFERLLSAFRNKLELKYLRSKYFLLRVGKYMKKNKEKTQNVTLESSTSIQFSDFTKYIIETYSLGYNEHWSPIATLCEPCYINYDFIGKYETLLEDSTFLLKKLGTNIKFPAVQKSNTSEVLRKYFSGMSAVTIRQLYNIYQNDFTLFSYSLEQIFGYEVF